MTAKFPGAPPTQDDYSATNAGMGREKANDKNTVDLDVNIDAGGYNQRARP